jgi:hypothetical protein
VPLIFFARYQSHIKTSLSKGLPHLVTHLEGMKGNGGPDNGTQVGWLCMILGGHRVQHMANDALLGAPPASMNCGSGLMDGIIEEHRDTIGSGDTDTDPGLIGRQSVHTLKEVQTAITHIGRRSMKLSQRLIDRKTGEVKCEGFSIMVAYDLEKGVSTEVWPEWIEALNRYEGRELRSEEEKS